CTVSLYYTAAISRLRSARRSPPLPYTTLFRSQSMTSNSICWLSSQTLVTEMVHRSMVAVSPRVISSIGRELPSPSEEITLGETRSEEHTSELQSRFDLV